MFVGFFSVWLLGIGSAFCLGFGLFAFLFFVRFRGLVFAFRRLGLLSILAVSIVLLVTMLGLVRIGGLGLAFLLVALFSLRGIAGAIIRLLTLIRLIAFRRILLVIARVLLVVL